MSDRISADDFAQLRAQLEAKQDELVAAIRALSRLPPIDRAKAEEPGSVGDNFFRLLGIVTYWLSLDAPPAPAAAAIREQLTSYRVTVLA